MKEYYTVLCTHSQLLSELSELSKNDWKLVSHTYIERLDRFHVIIECDISHLEIDTTKSE